MYNHPSSEFHNQNAAFHLFSKFFTRASYGKFGKL